jgi:hypothetical protein
MAWGACATQPTVDVMEQRLLAWGAWRAGGRCADGYPGTNVLHPSWSPPGGGQLPTMRAARSCDLAERLLDGKVQSLSVRLRDTLYAIYIKRMSAEQQAQVLQCQPSTVRARVVEAKRQIAAMR